MFIAVDLKKQFLSDTHVMTGKKKLSKKIDASTVLRDIKAGMSDSALMEKYNLSAKGVASLFRNWHH